MSWLRALGLWLEHRLRLRESLLPPLLHPIPRSSAGPLGWWYVFGSASLTLFLLQILTGIGLALVYVPTADRAYDSLIALNYDHPLGWYLRALHNTGASAMVVMVVVHMAQVFLFGAYKYPRELTWLVGVGLLLLTLGMAFTGQVLRWDADAYWGIGVGASMAGRVPLVGSYLVPLLLGGPIIGGDTLSRFFTLHVFVLPGLLLLSVGLHLWLVLKCGISEAPQPGKVVDPATYDRQYEKELEQGVPFLGEALMKDVFVSAVAVLTVVVIAAVVGPAGPSDVPIPAVLGANPRPDWPFLWLFALLSLSPPNMETFIILVLPVLLVAALLVVPLVSNRGERAPSRRPVAVMLVAVLAVTWAVLTYVGHQAPWSPRMQAWSGEPIPTRLVKGSTPVTLQGALVFQHKNCRNCHTIDGQGGERGPDLTAVGSRLTRDQIIDQVSNGTPGGGNMPAYGKQVRAAEMAALIEFLVGLRPKDEPVPRVASER